MKTNSNFHERYKAIVFTVVDERCLRRDSLFRGLKTVSGAPHRPKIAGLLWINFDLGAQFSYIHVHRARAHECSLFPDRVKDLVASKDAAGVPGQVKRLTELGRGFGVGG